MDTRNEILLDNTSTRLYEYEPLIQPNQIRLLEVEPADNLDAPLHGKLHHVDLQDDDRLTYVALSYAWGEHSTGQTLFIDGRPMLIQKNLYRALQYFRSNSADRYIWADAVCINQEEDGEKSWQIATMGRIFREALRVRVWLGDDAKDVERMKRVRAMTIAMIDFNNGAVRRGEYKSTTSNSALSNFMKLVQHLVNSTWFHRRWVIQEVALNPVVSLYCGFIEIPWPRLATTVEALHARSLRLRQSSKTQPLLSFIKVWRSSIISTDYNDILELLKDFRKFECKDDRDRIAALMALAGDIGPNPSQHQHHFRIDYTKSIEANYVAFAEALAASRQFYGLFSNAAHRRKMNGSTLPSWVPDWREEPRYNLKFGPETNRETVLQRSLTGMTHRLITPCKLYTNGSTATMLETKNSIMITKAEPESIQDIHTSSVFQDSADYHVFPMELVWKSSSDRFSRHVDVETSFRTWATRTAEDLFIWIQAQSLLHEGNSIRWALVFTSVLNFVTLGRISPSKFSIPESSPLEDHGANLQFTSQMFGKIDHGHLSKCMAHFEGSSIILCGEDGVSSTALEHYALGLVPEWARLGDKMAKLRDFRAIVQQGISADWNFFKESYYLFRRETSLALAQEEYTTIRLTTYLPSTPDAWISGKKYTPRIYKYEPESVMISTKYAYQLVGLCVLIPLNWGGKMRLDIADTIINSRLRSNDETSAYEYRDMGLVLC